MSRQQRYTIQNFNRQFPDDDACLEWLRNRRWPERIDCPTCKKATTFHRVRGRKVYECAVCGYQLSPTAGTIFHKSPTPLRLWFYAIFLMASTRCGISAKQLERELGVTYKTAWRMFTQIRKLMAEDIDPLSGDVELDEMYVGGKAQWKHASRKPKEGSKRGRGAAGKTTVFGMVQREGKIVAKVTPDVRASTLMPHVKTFVMPSSTCFTDELPVYNVLPDEGYVHLRVHHAEKVYVAGDAHTNTIEGFWSLVKRGIGGVHHVVGANKLQTYLDEYTFRWNHRNDEQPMFDALLGRTPSVLSSSTGG